MELNDLIASSEALSAIDERYNNGTAFREWEGVSHFACHSGRCDALREDGDKA